MTATSLLLHYKFSVSSFVAETREQATPTAAWRHTHCWEVAVSPSYTPRDWPGVANVPRLAAVLPVAHIAVSPPYTRTWTQRDVES